MMHYRRKVANFVLRWRCLAAAGMVNGSFFRCWFVGMPLPISNIALLILVLFAGAVFVPVWRILARAGLNPV